MAVDSLFHVAFVVIVVFSSLVNGAPTCEPITGASACTDAGVTQTYLPNDFGQTTVSAAATALSSNLDNVTLSDSCSSDLDLFACLLYFPDCRLNNATGENVVRRPCRDFCERVQAACVNLTAIKNVSCDAFSAWDPANPTACYDPFHLVVINEVNAENPNPGEDNSEYVELWDYGMGSTPLGEFVVVLGSQAASELSVYAVVNLTGAQTHPNGYFVIGQTSIGDFTPDAPLDVLQGRASVSLHRGSAADFPVDSDLTTVDLVDALVYHNFIPNNNLINVFYPGQEALLDSGNEIGSLSRCVSFSPLISSAYLFVLPTPGVRNNCSQRHLQTKITVHGKSLYNCCADASLVFCAFNINNLNADDGYCKIRNVQSSGLIPETASCSSSPEALAAVQPFLKQNILADSCSIASIERERATLISESEEEIRYSFVERTSANNEPNCSTRISSDECEVFLVSSLINNSTSELDVSASCDDDSVIGFTVGFDCSGTSEFPCLTKRPWKFVARSTSGSRIIVDIVSNQCGNSSACPDKIEINGDTAILDAPNDSETYRLNVWPASGVIRVQDEFTVELFYNDDLKITIEVAVLESANFYRAFTVVPEDGMYWVINEFVSV